MNESITYSQNQGMMLLNRVAEDHGPIFTIEDAYTASHDQELNKTRVRQVLSALAKSGWIVRLKRGVYMIQSPIFARENLHPFAIAKAILSPVAISHWSALAHHGLTTQIPPMVQASTTNQIVTPEMRQGAAYSPRGRAAWKVMDIEFEFVRVQEKHFYGFTEEWITAWHKVAITDPERTLLDMIAHPEIFGGVAFAMETLDANFDHFDINRLMAYTLRYDVGSVIKRLGWMLESLGVPMDRLEKLQAYPVKNTYRLETRGPDEGIYVPHWNILVNLPGIQIDD